MSDFRRKCHREGQTDRHLRRDPASGRDRGHGAVRARFPLHRLGACADRPRHDREHGARVPTCMACRRWCACPAMGRKRSPQRSTAARRRARAARLDGGAGARPRSRRRAIRRSASAASGPDARPATATASSNIWPRPTTKIVVAVQVETAEGLANVDAIAATEGVDVVFVGPGDLSVSIDAMGPAGAEEARTRRSRRSSPRR